MNIVCNSDLLLERTYFPMRKLSVFKVGELHLYCFTHKLKDDIFFYSKDLEYSITIIQRLPRMKFKYLPF